MESIFWAIGPVTLIALTVFFVLAWKTMNKQEFWGMTGFIFFTGLLPWLIKQYLGW